MFRPGSPLPGTDAEGGQPRPAPEARRPEAAERVRTLVHSSVSAVLTVPGPEESAPGGGDASPQLRTITPDGSVLMLVSARAAAVRAARLARGDELTAVMEITDVAPVSVPQRIRGRAWIVGWLTAVPEEEREEATRLLAAENPWGAPSGSDHELLRLEVGEAAVDDLWGAEQVEPDELAEAAPDPLVRHEAELLQHLAASHPEQIGSLASLVCTEGSDCEPADLQASAVPLALDRHGLRVRFCRTGRCFDARFEFPEPVASVRELRTAMHELLRAARG